MRRKNRLTWSNGFTWLGYLLMFAFFMIPVLWVISLALKTPNEIFGKATLIPLHPTFGNFISVLTTTKLPRNILNSLILVFVTVIGTLIVAALSSYSFSRFRFRNKNAALLVILLFQMVSPVIISIPLYLYYAKLHLLNNYFGLTMAYIAIQIPFATYLLKGIFDEIPRELDESATIDGASRMQILRRIIIPTAVPGIASATIFISINSWSQFVLPFFLLDKQNLFPVSIGVLLAQGTYQQISIQLVAAASVIGLLPAVLMVLFMQRFILSALLSGAVKG